MKRLSILLCILTLGVFIMAHTATAQTSFSIPPQSYPTKVPFKCDAGVDSYWHVTSVTCIGRANGGYKFRIKGMAQKTSRSLSIDLFYLMPGNRIMTAGTYYFPSIEAGKLFSFEIVSAFSGYAPSKFNGFFISSEVLQKNLLRESEESKAASNHSTANESYGTGTERQTSAKPRVDPNKVYKSSEVGKEPEYPGGYQALLSYIAKSIRYPWICKEQKIQGDVLVGFIVEKDGSISDVSAVRRVHANLNTEAVRVVKSLPKWEPGLVEGQPVRVQMGVYVKFRL